MGYRPPDIIRSVFIDAFSLMWDLILEEPHNVCVLGDQKCNFKSMSDDALKDLCISCGIHNIVSVPDCYHISCVITNCGQHQWSTPSPLLIVLRAFLGESTTRKLPSLSLDLLFKILLFQVAFLIFFFCRYLFSSLFSGGFVIAVCGSISVRELVKYLGSL